MLSGHGLRSNAVVREHFRVSPNQIRPLPRRLAPFFWPDWLKSPGSSQKTGVQTVSLSHGENENMRMTHHMGIENSNIVDPRRHAKSLQAEAELGCKSFFFNDAIQTFSSHWRWSSCIHANCTQMERQYSLLMIRITRRVFFLSPQLAVLQSFSLRGMGGKCFRLHTRFWWELAPFFLLEIPWSSRNEHSPFSFGVVEGFGFFVYTFGLSSPNWNLLCLEHRQ